MPYGWVLLLRNVSSATNEKAKLQLKLEYTSKTCATDRPIVTLTLKTMLN